MIKIDKGITVEGSIGKDTTKLLWDLLNVIGSRFVIIASIDEDNAKIDYKDKFKIVEKNKQKIAVLSFDNEDNFRKVLEILSDWCVTDFYVTVNSFFNNVVSKVDSNEMFSDYDFLIDEYLIEFPRTIHVKEDSFYIDFSTFKEYVYQLQRVAQRYMK